MFDLLDDPSADLATTRTVLVELKYAFYMVHAQIRKTFPTIAFAATLNVDSRSSLLRSIDDICLKHIREATKYAMDEGRYLFTDYEADRYVVWKGLDDAKLPLSTLSDRDVEAQLELMERRGCEDRIRVHMAIEVDVDDDENEVGEDEEGDIGSVTSVDSVQTVGTVQTVRTIA